MSLVRPNPERPRGAPHSSRSFSGRLRRTAAPACVILALSLPGCIFGSPGPSNVAEGQQYTTGSGTYDRFFSQLFLVQFDMGKAPDRLQAIRARLASAAGLPATATAEEVVAALETHAAKVEMSGTSMKVSTTGLDGKGPATAKLVTSGPVSNVKDVPFVTSVSESITDLGTLISDMRAEKPKVDDLHGQPTALEPGVDETFHLGGAAKKAEVHKNLRDADSLIPLMSTRADDVEHQATALLKELMHAVGSAPPRAVGSAPESAPPATERSPAPVTHTPKKKSAPRPAAASSETSAPSPAPKPKPAAPASDDFEP